MSFSNTFIISIFCALVCFSRTDNSPPLNAEDTLEETHGKIIFSSVVFRHGDRTPSDTYPNDPYPASTWPEGFYQLTKDGKQRAYQLGKWLHQRYQNTLVKKGYRYDLVRADSSDTDRTLMSAELVLAGAYPPSQDEIWADDGLKWQPTPVHSRPSGIDNIIGNKAQCDREDLEKNVLIRIPELNTLLTDNDALIQYLFDNAGMSYPQQDIYQTFELLWDLYDILFVQDSNNLTLPKWTETVYPEPFRTLASKRFEIDAYTLELKKLQTGPLLESIIEDMRNKQTSSTNQTIHLYSGHDTTVASLLISLQVYNTIVPPYSAAVIIELRQKHDEYVVTILYRNSSVTPPHLLKVHGCNDTCTLDEFVEVTSYLIPDDWDAECSVTIFTQLQYFSGIYQAVIIFGAIALVIFPGILIKLYLEDRKGRRKEYTPL